MGPKLSDTQLVILAAACQRDDRQVLPLPDRLKGGAATKVVDSLLAKGLIAEAHATLNDPIWRETEDERVTLVATDAAFQALGIESDDALTCAARAPKPKTAKARAKAAKRGRAAAKARVAREPREGTKQARLIAMLKRKRGASIDEIAAELEWQDHTVRGAIAGALKNKLGLDVTSEKDDKRGRVYRIA